MMSRDEPRLATSASTSPSSRRAVASDSGEYWSASAICAMAMALRAPVDLRVNTLKSDAEKAGRALESVGAKPMPELKNGFRIPAPSIGQHNAELLTALGFDGAAIEDLTKRGALWHRKQRKGK